MTQIPPGWNRAKLGDIGKVSMCKRIFKHETLSIGSIPFYKIGTFGKSADAFISDKVFEEYKNRYPYPKKGEILISASGTIGRTVEFDGEKAYFQDSNIIWVANPEDKVLNKFLKYLYLRVKWVSTDGGIISRLYNENLRSIQFNFPSLPEQNRIVAVLETWDKAIEKLKKRIDSKKQIKKQLMRDLLSEKKRLAGFNAKWNTKEFGELVILGKDRIDPRKSDKKYMCLELEHLDQITGKIIGNSTTADTLSIKTIFSKGDVLFGKLRAYLRKYWLADREGVCSTEIWALKPAKDILSEYLFQIVQTDKFIYSATMSHGTHMPRSSWEVVSSQEIDLPSIEEQEAILKILVSSDQEIDLLSRELRLFQDQKKYLLNNLITGNIRTPETLS